MPPFVGRVRVSFTSHICVPFTGCVYVSFLVPVCMPFAGRVCVPIDPVKVDSFEPSAVPTIRYVANQIQYRYFFIFSEIITCNMSCKKR